MSKNVLWVSLLLIMAVCLVPLAEAKEFDPRTTTVGQTNAITVSVTKNQVSITVSGSSAVFDWQVEGTTSGTVHHLSANLIEESTTGATSVVEFPEIPEGNYGGFTIGLEGTGAGGARSSWRHVMSGTIQSGSQGSPDVSDSNLRRIVGCYVAYGDEGETQWNYACVTVFGQGAGNLGSGDQTGGPAGVGGSSVSILLVVLIIVVVVLVIVAVVVARRRRATQPPPPMQPPLQPPMQPPTPPPQ